MKILFFLISSWFLIFTTSKIQIIGVSDFPPLSICQKGNNITLYEANKQIFGVRNNGILNFHGYDIDFTLYFKNLNRYLAKALRWNLKEIFFLCAGTREENMVFLQEGKTDMAIGGLPYKFAFNNAMDSTSPIITTEIKMIVRKNEIHDYFSFMKSFDTLMYIMILVTAFVVGMLTWVFEDQSIYKGVLIKKKRTNIREMGWQSFSSIFFTSEIRLQKTAARFMFISF